MDLSFNPILAVPCFMMLNGFMRLAFCKSFRIAFSGHARLTEERLREERDRLFTNLIGQETLIDTIDSSNTEDVADLVVRMFNSLLMNAY